MSELQRLVNEYRQLWSAPASSWQQDYPGLFQLSQALAAKPPLNEQGELDAAPFQEELPWLPRLQRLAALPQEKPLADHQLQLLLADSPQTLVEWDDKGVNQWLEPSWQLITVSPRPPRQRQERQLWHEADLLAPEALHPLKASRQLLALDMGLSQAQHLLVNACKHQVAQMVLEPSRFYLIDTSYYEPLTSPLPPMGDGILKLLSVAPDHPRINWSKLLVPWLFRPALRKLILDDLSSYGQRRGYAVQLQPLSGRHGRQALVLRRQSG